MELLDSKGEEDGPMLKDLVHARECLVEAVENLDAGRWAAALSSTNAAKGFLDSDLLVLTDSSEKPGSHE